MKTQIKTYNNRKQMKRTVFPFTDGRFSSNSLVNYEYDATSQVQYENYVQATGGNPFLVQQYINDAAGNRETHNLTYFNENRSIAGDYEADNRLEALHITFPPRQRLTIFSS
jgi:hypothetical protein